MPKKIPETQPGELDLQYMRLDEFIERSNPLNPKDHDIGGIMGAIKRWGFIDVPIIDERTGQIVSGHGRGESLWEKMQESSTPPARIRVDEDGMWMLPVIRGVSFNSDEEKDAYTVAANRLVEKGGWIAEKLKELSEGIDDPELRALAGLDDQVMQDLIALASSFDDVDFGAFEGVKDFEIRYRVVIDDLTLEEAERIAVEMAHYNARVDQYRTRDLPTLDDIGGMAS